MAGELAPISVVAGDRSEATTTREASAEGGCTRPASTERVSGISVGIAGRPRRYSMGGDIVDKARVKLAQIRKKLHCKQVQKVEKDMILLEILADSGPLGEATKRVGFPFSLVVLQA